MADSSSGSIMTALRKLQKEGDGFYIYMLLFLCMAEVIVLRDRRSARACLVQSIIFQPGLLHLP